MKNYRKLFKRVLSLVLCLVLSYSLLVPVFAGSNGVSASAGIDALRAQFDRAVGPKTDGYAIDYSYFSPVKANDSTKYPIVVFTGGGGQGGYPGQELEANDFAMWSSKEYQAKFYKSNGAFIIFARSPQEKGLFWTADVLYNPFMAMLRDFISKYEKNVDTSRIYLGGWCFGGQAVWKIAAANPNFFAAIMPMSPFYSPSESEVKKLANTAIWMYGCKADVYAPYAINVAPAWSKVKEYTAVPEKCRLTSFDTYKSPNNTNHNTWYYASYDMQLTSGFTGVNTVDAAGNTITPDSMISWLSKQTTFADYDFECDCPCHSSNILVRFIWNIRVTFYKIFAVSSQKECKCGVSHW